MARLQAVQPYMEGGGWTRNLQLLSNPDKHRHLIKLGMELSKEFRPLPAADVPDEAGASHPLSIEETSAATMRLMLDDGDNGVDALGVLAGIQIGAYDLLMSFEEDFRRGR